MMIEYIITEEQKKFLNNIFIEASKNNPKTYHYKQSSNNSNFIFISLSNSNIYLIVTSWQINIFRDNDTNRTIIYFSLEDFNVKIEDFLEGEQVPLLIKQKLIFNLDFFKNPARISY